MEEASANYLMFVGNQDSLITDQFIAYSRPRLTLSIVAEIKKTPVPELKWKSCCHIHMVLVTMN